jgi:hypothetical protein
MNSAKKLILDQIEDIDNVQAERLLLFMKGMLSTASTAGSGNRTLKQKAIREIRAALANQSSQAANW